MKVDVLQSTDKPERLVCQAARGDYYGGYVGDTEYETLMKSVDYDDSDVFPDESCDADVVVEAKTKAFIEKQLSRGHYGPWEHPQITFTVGGVSRVTMAQITRHRHLTFDVQSQRYVDFSDVEAVTPDSLTTETLSRENGITDVENQAELRELYERHTEDALQCYEQMVDDGVPKEDARFVLPLGTPVNMTFSGNARTFLHLLDMRRKANAQWEIRQLSDALLDELFEWMPYTFEYYKDHGPNKLSP